MLSEGQDMPAIMLSHNLFVEEKAVGSTLFGIAIRDEHGNDYIQDYTIDIQDERLLYEYDLTNGGAILVNKRINYEDLGSESIDIEVIAKTIVDGIEQTVRQILTVQALDIEEAPTNLTMSG